MVISIYFHENNIKVSLKHKTQIICTFLGNFYFLFFIFTFFFLSGANHISKAFLSINELKEESEQEAEAKKSGILLPENLKDRAKTWTDKSRSDLDSQIYLLLDCFIPEKHIIPLLDQVYLVFEIVQKSCKMRSKDKKCHPKVDLLPIRKDSLTESKQ